VNNTTFFVNIWVTLRCNFRCKYCYVKSKYIDKDLDTYVADNIIKFICNNLLPNQELIINFHGGEPTLNYSIIKYIIKNINNKITNKTTYGITTNGSLLTNEMINFLGNNFTYNLSVSLDGKEDTNNLNRICLANNENLYSQILINAKKLLEINKRTRIRMTLQKNTINKLYENIIFFIKNDFKVIVPVADYFSNEWTDDDFKTIKEQLHLVKDFIKINGITDVEIYNISNQFYSLGQCTAGESYYNIDVFGDIYPCTHLIGLDDLKIGNVYNGVNLIKINEIKEINREMVQECKDCELYRYCLSTRCLLVNYVTTGDYYKPNLVHCNMLNIKVDLVE